MVSHPTALIGRAPATDGDAAADAPHPPSVLAGGIRREIAGQIRRCRRGEHAWATIARPSTTGGRSIGSVLAMRTTTRRRVDVLVLGAGGLAIGAITALGGLLGDPERVNRLWVGAALDDGGGADVVEVIDYDFGAGQDKHGIFRTIPGLTTDSAVRVSSASAPSGIAAKTSELVGGEPGIRLKIGDPNITISGRHRYRLDYALPTLATAGRLAWDAVGAAWTVPIRQTEIHVVAPWRFDALLCSTGRTGATGGCTLTQPEPGHLMVEVGSLASGEGVTIEASRGPALLTRPSLPAPPITAPPDPGAGLARPAALAVIASLGSAGVVSRQVRRRGRERVGGGGAAEAAWAGGGGPTSEILVDQVDLASLATTEFAPPEGITAAQGGTLLAEAVRSEHKVAWLLEAAIAGAVDLDDDADAKSVRLIRTSGGSPDVGPILDVAFAGRPEIHLGSYDEDFAAGWTRVGTTLAGWQRQSGYWDPAGTRRRTVVRILGSLALVVGAIGSAAFGAPAAAWGAQWLPAVAVAAAIAGGGLAAAVRAWELKVRTPAGSGMWLRVESFRRFLAGSEATHAEEAAKRGVLREYTAWAVALGEMDRWGEAVAASTVIPQDAGLSYVHLAPILASSTSSASTAPSSSGGGGGGGVGGGGGGGGGGSW